jgi:hypothetical protein
MDSQEEIILRDQIKNIADLIICQNIPKAMFKLGILYRYFDEGISHELIRDCD